MSKNIYLEEVSGNFESFDYYLDAEIKESGVVEISAFINHKHINFNNIVNDLKTMINCLSNYYELNGYDFSLEESSSECKDYEVNVNTSECEINILIFNSDFDKDSLVQSFAYSVGYIQSFLLHNDLIIEREEKDT